jgi:hypothetical protein
MYITLTLHLWNKKKAQPTLQPAMNSQRTAWRTLYSPTSALYPGKEIRYPFYRRLGGPQGRSGRVRKISPPTGAPQTVQPVESPYTDYAIPAHHTRNIIITFGDGTRFHRIMCNCCKTPTSKVQCSNPSVLQMCSAHSSLLSALSCNVLHILLKGWWYFG